MFHPCSIRGYFLAGAMLLGLASLAWACNVPVFRFALERWRPDPYRVVLLHRGPLVDADRELVAPLVEHEDSGTANLALRTIDVDSIDASTDEGMADAALVAALGEVELPLVVVQYPSHLKIAKPVWTGAPTSAAISRLLESPARKELARRLADGQTAVWLVLEPGIRESGSRGSGVGSRESPPALTDASRSPAAALVETEIKKLASELKLPQLTDAPEDAISAKTPLKIEFSALRISKDDPAEQALVAMLVGCEPDLAERTGDTIVFPVFGRGRALWPLVGAGITARNIGDSAGFLVGACSCEVKELNPGFDLLLAVDWDELLAQGPVPLGAVQTKATAIPEQAELVPIPTGEAPAPPAPTAPPAPPAGAVYVVSETRVTPVAAMMPRWIMLAGGGLLVLLVLVAVVVAIAGASRARGPSD